MSQRRKHRDRNPSINAKKAEAIPSQSQEEIERDPWYKNRIIIAISSSLITFIIGPLITTVVSDFYHSRFNPSLSFTTRETRLVNGNVLSVELQNSGSTPEQDVVIILNSHPATYMFSKEHVHSHVSFDLVATTGRLEVRLKNRVDSSHPITVFFDEIFMKPNEYEFSIGVTSNSGVADRKSHRVEDHRDLTLKELLYPSSQ